MTILTKNEADIIEKNLLFHRAMGVDAFIVTDNASTDGTREIYEKYLKKGWIIEIIDEPGQDYSQAEWVDRMIHRAKELGADWIINADADEFWTPKSGSLKDDLINSKANVLLCPIFNIIPENEKEFWKNTKMITARINQDTYNLAKFNVFGISIPKVIHRASGYQKIHMGNHNVDMLRKKSKKTNSITIYHYNIRSKEHFITKMMTGGAAFARNTKLGKTTGAHWRYYYEGQKNGTLNLHEEYDKCIGKEYWNIFSDMKVFTEATAVKTFFNNEK